jgi:IS4 transposase
MLFKLKIQFKKKNTMGRYALLVILTNNFVLAATTSAQIYKKRWNVELFFKWIKQNLKINSFLGTSKTPFFLKFGSP